eukprot:1897567-Pleurochrysis_carterae.AAC.3
MSPKIFIITRGVATYVPSVSGGHPRSEHPRHQGAAQKYQSPDMSWAQSVFSKANNAPTAGTLEQATN